MTEKNQTGHWLLLAVLCYLSVAGAVAGGVGGGPIDKAFPAFSWSETAAEPVIEYNLVHHMLAEQSPLPLLRIYGNGRLQVHYPAWMTRAGDYELQLSQAELRTLLRGLVTDGILDFDAAAARQQRQQHVAQQRAADGTLYYVSDSSDTVITIRLKEYQGTRDLKKQFVWPDLKQDARRFPELRELARADSAAQRLAALLQRPDLVKTR